MTKIILLCAFTTLCGCTNMNITMQKNTIRDGLY